MAEHLTEDDLLRAQEEGGTALAVGGLWDFTGPDVTIADNSGLDKTVITIGAGSTNLTLQHDNFAHYVASNWGGSDGYVTFPSTPGVEGAGFDCLGGGSHSPATGHFQVNQAGLYAVNLLVEGVGLDNGAPPTYPPVIAMGTTEYDSTHQIRWEDEVFQSRGQFVSPGYWTVHACVNFTTTLVADDVLFALAYGLSFQSLEYNFFLDIARIA
jgi:hypothetical protein